MPPTLYIAGDDRVITVHDGVTRIGRSITADVELEDMTVSRRHALVVHGDGQTVLLDDGSRNGTFLNGARIDRAALQDGDEIGLGAARLRYAIGALIAAWGSPRGPRAALWCGARGATPDPRRPAVPRRRPGPRAGSPTRDQRQSARHGRERPTRQPRPAAPSGSGSQRTHS